MTDQETAAPVVHFVPYGEDWTACNEYDQKPSTDQRNRTTCLRCRSKFTDPTDSELVLQLLARLEAAERGEHHCTHTLSTESHDCTCPIGRDHLAWELV